MTAQIQVELIGANGSRITEVKAAGFTTRHINRSTVRASLSIKVTPNFPIAPKTEPKQPLAKLLAEVDNLLDPPARVNTAPICAGCYHYENPTKPKIDYDSPARAWWRRVEQRKSDALMASKKAVQ